MSYNWPKTFHLMRGGDLLAVLKGCEPEEMFWVACEIEKTDAFAEVEAIIREATQALDDEDDMDTFEANYDKLEEMGVKLIDADRNLEMGHFIIHFRNGTISMRYSDPTLK